MMTVATVMMTVANGMMTVAIDMMTVAICMMTVAIRVMTVTNALMTVAIGNRNWSLVKILSIGHYYSQKKKTETRLLSFRFHIMWSVVD